MVVQKKPSTRTRKTSKNAVEGTQQLLQRIRISYHDPDATDSSSDEESRTNYTLRRMKQTKRVIADIFVQRKSCHLSCPDVTTTTTATAATTSARLIKREDENPTISRRPSSTYKGVRMRKWGRFAAEIRNPFKKTREWLGTFDTPEEASAVYQNKLREFKAKLSVQSQNGAAAETNVRPSPTDVAAIDVKKVNKSPSCVLDNDNAGSASTSGALQEGPVAVFLSEPEYISDGPSILDLLAEPSDPPFLPLPTTSSYEDLRLFNDDEPGDPPLLLLPTSSSYEDLRQFNDDEPSDPSLLLLPTSSPYEDLRQFDDLLTEPSDPSLLLLPTSSSYEDLRQFNDDEPSDPSLLLLPTSSTYEDLRQCNDEPSDPPFLLPPSSSHEDLRQFRDGNGWSKWITDELLTLDLDPDYLSWDESELSKADLAWIDQVFSSDDEEF